jgi:hypothetical protein
MNNRNNALLMAVRVGEGYLMAGLQLERKPRGKENQARQ